MSAYERFVSDVSVIGTGVLIVVGLVVLAVRLHAVQVESAAEFNVVLERQRIRRVRTAAPRGRILDCRGRELAANRTVRSLALVIGSDYQKKDREATVAAVTNAIAEVCAQLGIEPDPKSVTFHSASNHVSRRLALPYVFKRDIDDDVLARFSEQIDGVRPGFVCVSETVRVHPQHSLAAHLVGITGRDDAEGDSGDVRVNFRERELVGRSGLEAYYDGFLRGVSGERQLVVAALGYMVREAGTVDPVPGPDLRLTLDIDIQRKVESLLGEYEKGACAVIDPETGAVLALASNPSYDLDTYSRDFQSLNTSPKHPLVNRASGGWYAPGSTFKPITALAALRAGIDSEAVVECNGVFELPGMKLHCSRRWGHGDVGMCDALKESCNTYFAHVAQLIGTNALFRAAREFGLGEKSGIDLFDDAPGTVPDGRRGRGLRGQWWTGELSQMAIGQGQLLVTPLQMARVAGALGTGFLVTPHLRAGIEPKRQPLPFSAEHLDIVREGMRRVVDGGTGRRGGEGVTADVLLGKTGTAEVGSRTNRRKNTWFIAYARRGAKSVAVAMVIEDGESGGLTTAPLVAEVLQEALR